MKWDVDKAIAVFEPESCPGTAFTRAYLPLNTMVQHKIKPTPADIERGGANVWCLSIGISYAPKAFFYARTMREAFLRARRSINQKNLAKHTPWGVQPFEPKIKKSKARKKTSRKEV